MGFKFDQEQKLVELSSQNLKWLADCDSRIRGVRASIATPESVAEAGHHYAGVVLSEEQGGRELARLEMVRKDLVKKLSKDEKAEYKDHVKASEQKTLTAEEQAAIVKQMEQNKDRASH